MRNYIKEIVQIIKSITKKLFISVLKEFDLIIIQKIKKMSKSATENPYNFYDLTPTCDCDKDNKYSKSLEWALNNENIKNIAITGSYGSGKSSILKSFFDKNKGYKVLNISLASFSELNGKNDDKILELSILQQMFYQVKHEDIPDSRFKRIKNLKKSNIIVKTLFISIWIFATTLFFFPKIIKTSEKLNIFFNNDFIKITSLLIIILGIAYLVSKLLRIFNNNKINKLNIQSGEIELKSNIDPSILNKHLDEILYFFEVTNYEVVIIEDLDRSKNKKIFPKLREINQLINQSKQINKRIVFIYAIKDDLFLDKNRTKFFDFIIPVIPVINTFNSGNILLNKLNEANLINKISSEELQNISINQENQNSKISHVVNTENSKDEIPNNEKQANEPIDSNNLISIEFINDISIYIDDMRLLKNIYNEYILFRDILDPKLNQDKLLAMIIYKNISPSDFADLHYRKGKVYSIFERKKEFIENRISEIEKDIEKENKKLIDFRNLKIKDVKELRSIYLYKILQKIPNAKSFHIENNPVNFIEVLSDKNFSKIQQNSIKYYINLSSPYQDSGFSFQDIENELDNENPYKYREELILGRNNSFENFTISKIEEMKKERDEYDNYTLKQLSEKISNSEFKKIVNKSNTTKIESEEVGKDIKNYFKENELNLVDYFIRNGYINENYEDYISYFFEGFLTKTDRDFLFSIKNRNELDFEYKLKNIDFILKKINVNEFENTEVLNISLLEFLIDNKDKYVLQYKTILNQITNNSFKSNLFIESARKLKNIFEILIIDICINNFDFWDNVILSEVFINKNDYLIYIIKNVDIDVIVKLNANNNLSTYISNLENIENLFKEQEFEKIKHLFSKLNIKFSRLSIPKDINELYDHIYKENLYMINDHMIKLFIQYWDNAVDLSNFERNPYTTIIASAEINMKQYILKSIQEFVSKVFLNKINISDESEDAIIDLLNKDLFLEQKQKIVDKYGYKFELSSKFTDNNVLDYLFLRHKIRAYWENIANYYYKYNEININLLSFLNFEENYMNLSMSRINDSVNNEKLKLLLSEAILLNNNISDKAYSYLYPCCNKIDFPSEFELSEKKIIDLIISNNLQLSQENFTYLKTKFPLKNLHIDLLIYNIDYFSDNILDFELNDDEIALIFKSTQLTKDELINIYFNLPSERIIENQKICSILSVILSDHDDIEIIFEELLSFIKYASTLEIKVKLLNHQIIHLSFDQIDSLLQIIGDKYLDITIPKRQRTFSNTISNKELFQKLEEKKYIKIKIIKNDKIVINSRLS